MLIRYANRPFVFVANVKAASTSIERSAFATAADIRITRTELGKHAPVSEIEDRFSFLFDEMPREEFFWFGVIRDPVEWVLSWYNFRSRPALAELSHPNHGLFAGNLTVEQFWEQQQDDPGLVPQSERFRSRGAGAGVDFLIDMADLSGGTAAVADLLGVRLVRIPKRNASTSRTGDVAPALRKELMRHYAADYELLGNLAAMNEAGLERFRGRFADQPAASVSLAGLRKRLRARLGR